MKSSFYSLLILIISGSFLFSGESKSSTKLKVPMSYLPSTKNDEVTRENKEDKPYYKKNPKRKAKEQRYKRVTNSWEPYWVSSNTFEEPRNLFFQMNIGVGFLYFSGVQGNLGGNPGDLFRTNGSVPYQGRLTYNRTPILEYLIGYKFKSYLRAAISYQHQSAVTIQTKAISAQPNTTSPNIRGAQSLLRFNFSEDAFMLKGYLDFPWPMVWKMMAYSPYLGAGIGIGWQSWVNNTLTAQSLNNGYSATQLFLRSKYSVNCVWGVDVGIKAQVAKPSKNFALYGGVKYNQWGQARNIGEVQNQGASKLGLSKPFRIKTVYSFAPYIGFQWNIESSSFAPPSYKIDNRSVDTWKAFIVDADQLQKPQATFVSFNGGIGFLYFAGIKGDISLIPPDGRQSIGQFPGKYSLNYNRTPVVEYLFGYRLNPWVKVAISKQGQGNLFINTAMKHNVNGAVSATSRLQANLNLLSAAAKLFIEVPKTLIVKNLASNFYLAAAVGPSWQSWTRMGVATENTQDVAFSGSNQATGDFFPLRAKIIPNVFVSADAGIKVKNATPKVNFYMVAGCRYNYWGSVRNLGKITEQYPEFREGLFKPFNVNTLYSFVPYLGVQWNFEGLYKYNYKKPFTIDKKDVHTWRPFLACLKGLEKERSFFAQVNTGVGFLYFERLRVNLAGEPSENAMDIFGESSYSGTPSYNRTPLFEYLIGTRIFDWWNMFISYQYQGGVEVSTPTLKPTNPVQGNSGFVAQANCFVSNFRTDAIMAKFYFNSPISIVFLGFISTPYIAPGVGIGWQSWTRADVERIGNLPALSLGAQMDQPINQKISANFVWTIDVGIRSSTASVSPHFSSTLGFKFIDWGQAYQMGKPGDQRGSSLSLFKPFSVRMVYSFAPYFGVQWNF